MEDLMTDTVSVIRLGKDTEGEFDEDSWTIENDDVEQAIYTGPALVSQDQDLPATQDTEGYEQQVQQYTCSLPQGINMPETVAGDVLLWRSSERSPQMVGERFTILGERHSTLRICRKLIMQRRETRTQL
jgi:hypothetical protein